MHIDKLLLLDIGPRSEKQTGTKSVMFGKKVTQHTKKHRNSSDIQKKDMSSPFKIAVNVDVVIASDVSCTCSRNLKLLWGTPSTKNSAALTEHVATEALKPK